MQAQFTQLLHDLGKIVGLDDLAPNKDDNCVLGIDDFIVTLCLQGSSLLMYSPVGTLGEGDKEKLLTRLLNANYFFSGTAGATLALSPIDNEIQLLCHERLQGLGVSDLVIIVESFLERLTYWTGVCGSVLESVPETEKNNNSIPQGFPMGAIRG